MYNPNSYYNPYMQQMPQQMAQLPSQNIFNSNSFLGQNISQQPPQQSYINGKVVDSEDILKVTEIPMGGYGVFPKADFSEIYMKYWKDNGTTEIVTFKPVEQKNSILEQENAIKQILEKIEQLDQKLNALYEKANTSVANPVAVTRKEVSINEY